MISNDKTAREILRVTKTIDDYFYNEFDNLGNDTRVILSTSIRTLNELAQSILKDIDDEFNHGEQ